MRLQIGCRLASSEQARLAWDGGAARFVVVGPTPSASVGHAGLQSDLLAGLVHVGAGGLGAALLEGALKRLRQHLSVLGAGGARDVADRLGVGAHLRQRRLEPRRRRALANAAPRAQAAVLGSASRRLLFLLLLLRVLLGGLLLLGLGLVLLLLLLVVLLLFVFLQVLLKVGGLTLRNLGKLGVVAAETVRCQFGVMRSGQRAWAARLADRAASASVPRGARVQARD